jgi:hypothetical protein
MGCCDGPALTDSRATRLRPGYRAIGGVMPTLTQILIVGLLLIGILALFGVIT